MGEIMTIREATVEDLPNLEPLAKQFFASSKHLAKCEFPHFVSFWTRIMNGGIGHILLMCDSDGSIKGALGFGIHPYELTMRLQAVEFFWFVLDEWRGYGLRLYRAYEKFAKEQGCVEIRMGHLPDLNAVKMCEVYTRLGFEIHSIHYIKELSA